MFVRRVETSKTERNLIQNIFPQAQEQIRNQVFTMVTQEAIELFIEAGENLRTRMEKGLVTISLPEIYQLLDLVKHSNNHD